MRFTMRISQVLYTVQVKNIPHILCTDEQLRQDMIKAGKTYALNFTDEKLACDLMNTYEKL